MNQTEIADRLEEMAYTLELNKLFCGVDGDEQALKIASKMIRSMDNEHNI